MAAETSRMGLVQTAKQVQTNALDLEEVRSFWTNRIQEFGECMGAPSVWIKQLLHEYDGNWDPVTRIIRKEEARLLDQVINIIRFLCQHRYSDHHGKLKKPISVLEIGCGTGNMTIQLAKLEAEGLIELTTGDITPEAIRLTKQKLCSHHYPEIAKRVHHLVASSLTKPFKHPDMIDQVYYDPATQPFNVIIKGRLGHRLVGDTWVKSYQEVSKMLPPNGAVLFYEPLNDLNFIKHNDSHMREMRTSKEYRHLLEKRLKLELHTWKPFDVFHQAYILAAYLKVSR